ncbi:hypothetical protein M0R45_013077 [Rubus argutus]|uniref:Uncharacterized protein n=1 Tax=Rubus argutus TaxID=59490 RepID=A0AAW1XH91_RUBAR
MWIMSPIWSAYLLADWITNSAVGLIASSQGRTAQRRGPIDTCSSSGYTFDGWSRHHYFNLDLLKETPRSVVQTPLPIELTKLEDKKWDLINESNVGGIAIIHMRCRSSIADQIAMSSR